MGRPMTPTKTSISLPDHEVRNTALQGGKLPVRGGTSNPYGDKGHTIIGDGSAAAAQAAAERHEQRERPKLAERRERENK
jgi:hypothetical protein